MATFFLPHNWFEGSDEAPDRVICMTDVPTSVAVSLKGTENSPHIVFSPDDDRPVQLTRDVMVEKASNPHSFPVLLWLSIGNKKFFVKLSPYSAVENKQVIGSRVAPLSGMLPRKELKKYITARPNDSLPYYLDAEKMSEDHPLICPFLDHIFPSWDSDGILSSHSDIHRFFGVAAIPTKAEVSAWVEKFDATPLQPEDDPVHLTLSFC